jgi:site-specific DNA-methyltransferase (adenine-specific)
MVLCDLPYGMTNNRWDTPLDLDRVWALIECCCKSTAAKVFTASQPFSSVLVCSNPKEFRHEWIWIKNRGSNFANTVRAPMKEHEAVLVFSKGKWTYNRQMQPRTGTGADRVKHNVAFRSKSENYREFEGRENNALPELRVPSSWQKFNTDTSGLHPTIKPVPLMEYLIKTYTDPGETVLDFTMGSGTTGVAAANLGRLFVGIENDADYFAKAADRIRAAYAARQYSAPKLVSTQGVVRKTHLPDSVLSVFDC